MDTLASSLGAPGQAPGPINLPDTSTPYVPGVQPPSVGLAQPGQPLPPGGLVAQEPATPPAEHTAGRAFGKILSGLSGSTDQYSIDPATGKTITTQVKTPPGQWARGILAAGLLGGQGIGPEHGQHTFAQGLLAGLGGGVKESTEMAQQRDAQRREQAQQQYNNQLKAQENTRQDKELNMHEQLNKVAIAKENAELATQQMIAADHLKNDQLQAAQFGLEADKSVRDAYDSLGIKPVQGMDNLTSAQGQDLLKQNSGAGSKYKIVRTGVRSVLDDQGHVVAIEPTYSAYPMMNKVPPTMIKEMADAGWDKPGTQGNATYKKLLQDQAQDKDVNYTDLSTVFGQLQDWEKVQDRTLGIKVKQTEIAEHQAAIGKDYLEAQAAKYDLGKKEDFDAAGKLFSDRFNPKTGELNVQDLNPIDPKTVPAKDVRKTELENAKKAHDKQLLTQYALGQYQASQQDFFNHYKPTKDADGNYVSDDPQAAGFTQYLNNLQNGLNVLHGGKPNAPPDAAHTPPSVPNYTAKINGIDTPVAIPTAELAGFLARHPEARPFGPAKPAYKLNATGQAIQDATTNYAIPAAGVASQVVPTIP